VKKQNVEKQLRQATERLEDLKRERISLQAEVDAYRGIVRQIKRALGYDGD
jgi:uncharacterized protein YlxW (UPF0749 family)